MGANLLIFLFFFSFIIIYPLGAFISSKPRKHVLIFNFGSIVIHAAVIYYIYENSTYTV
jgi:hypothetical protein